MIRSSWALPITLLLGFALTDVPALGQTSPMLSEASPWLADLDFLVETIVKRHKNPTAHLSAADFQKRVAAVRAAMATAKTDRHRAVLLGMVAAAVGDGHTNVQVYGEFPRFPVSWYWFGRELRINGARPDAAWLLGARVVKIGGLPIREALERIRTLIPQRESENFVLDWSQALLRMPDVLSALSIGEGRAVPLLIRLASGKEQTVQFDPVSAAELSSVQWARPYATPTLAQSRPDDEFWFQRIEGTHVMYSNFTGYPERTLMRRTAEDLAAALAAPDVDALLVDMRRNGGGDFKMGRRLIDLLKPAIAERKIEVYVAIGRQTFSAGMTNATDFKAAFDARYLGEVSGARPNGFQENFSFELPNSRIKGSVAREFYRFQEQDTPGLFPDVSLPPTWADFAAGRDAIVDWTLRRVAARNAGVDQK
jgi:hypothetical protein